MPQDRGEATRRGTPPVRPCDPVGPHGEASSLRRIQRAVVDLVCEHGYPEVTVADVVRRAEVEQEQFHRYFAGVQDCCIETFEAIAHRCEAHLYAAYDVPGSWRFRLRGAAYAAADFLRDNPREARFALLELRRGSDLARARVEAAVEFYTDLVDDGRQELEDPTAATRATARATVGAILNQVVDQARVGHYPEVEQFVPGLMYLAVRPYLGQQAAMEELTMPRPPHSPADDG